MSRGKVPERSLKTLQQLLGILVLLRLIPRHPRLLDEDGKGLQQSFMVALEHETMMKF